MIGYANACKTCKHEKKEVTQDPCRNCKWVNSSNNWEPKE